jgi:hypothetical protein
VIFLGYYGFTYVKPDVISARCLGGYLENGAGWVEDGPGRVRCGSGASTVMMGGGEVCFGKREEAFHFLQTAGGGSRAFDEMVSFCPALWSIPVNI